MHSQQIRISIKCSCSCLCRVQIFRIRSRPELFVPFCYTGVLNKLFDLGAAMRLLKQLSRLTCICATAFLAALAASPTGFRTHLSELKFRTSPVSTINNSCPRLAHANSRVSRIRPRQYMHAVRYPYFVIYFFCAVQRRTLPSSGGGNNRLQ